MFINRNSSPPVVLRFNPYEPHIAVADRLGVKWVSSTHLFVESIDHQSNISSRWFPTLNVLYLKMVESRGYSLFFVFNFSLFYTACGISRRELNLVISRTEIESPRRLPLWSCWTRMICLYCSLAQVRKLSTLFKRKSFAGRMLCIWWYRLCNLCVQTGANHLSNAANLTE